MKIFNWIAKLILDETSKLPSSRKVIAFIFAAIGCMVMSLIGFIVFKMDQGNWTVTSDKLRSLDILISCIYICCGMVLLLLAVVTMQQLINFRTSSKYNSAPGEMPADAPAVQLPDNQNPQP